MEITILVSIITGGLTLLGIIIVNIRQFLTDKGKNSSELLVQLLEQALKLNKQELDAVRAINLDFELKLEKLNTKIDTKDKEIEQLKDRVETLEKENKELKELLEDYLKTKGESNDKAPN